MKNFKCNQCEDTGLYRKPYASKSTECEACNKEVKSLGTMEDLRETILEELNTIEDKICQYLNNRYTINDISSMVNDRREYDRLIGKRDALGLTLARINRSLNDE